MTIKWRQACVVSLLLAQAATANVLANQTFDAASNVIGQADRNGAKSQQRINQLDDNTRALLDETRKALAKAEQLALYNAQMATIIANQEAELESIQAQISTIDETEEGVLPLMQLMVEQLTVDINAGAPFLSNERKTRVAILTDMLGRADVSVSEKFRRVLEALQIEVDYGRTIEAYSQKENTDNSPGMVTAYNFLRIGRIALYRQTLDGNQAWLWFNDEWQPLGNVSGSANNQISLARRVAEQTVAPQLITLPLTTPTTAHTTETLESKEGGQ
jgi:non-canonical (house-cleaning) NTP pyrophosphatase